MKDLDSNFIMDDIFFVKFGVFGVLGEKFVRSVEDLYLGLADFLPDFTPYSFVV